MRPNWTIRNTYLYLVCLITLVMVILSAVSVVRGLVTVLYPEPVNIVTDAEIEKGIMEADMAMQQEWSRRYAVISLVGSAGMLLIAAPVYVAHWRKIERP
jgi:hypothetical protein